MAENSVEKISEIFDLPVSDVRREVLMLRDLFRYHTGEKRLSNPRRRQARALQKKYRELAERTAAFGRGIHVIYGDWICAEVRLLESLKEADEAIDYLFAVMAEPKQNATIKWQEILAGKSVTQFWARHRSDDQLTVHFDKFKGPISGENEFSRFALSILTLPEIGLSPERVKTIMERRIRQWIAETRTEAEAEMAD
ncbi:MAG: hypothetical protein NXI30_18870 [bacterium]|nr:hypothetical protein [bacterium]